MCGITGVLNLNGQPVSEKVLKSMADSIKHRGPDSEGFFVDGWLGFGHRRLSIIDLSVRGKQPMSTPDGEITVIYNGEIYNFKELKTELERRGHSFISTSDTEVILYAYKEWGIDCINRFNGIFAFALWDSKKRNFYLVRDRFGVKPVYYYQDRDVFVFGSEIKAILKHPRVKCGLDFKALREYFTFQNLFSNRTLFENIFLLEHGHYIKYDCRKFEKKKYWDYEFKPRKMSRNEAVKKVRETFESAVVRQLVSDVPVASFLSGGMDTGSIVAVASKHLPKLNTFTGGFDLKNVTGREKFFDEREAARFLARKFKTNHHETVINPHDGHRVLHDLMYHLEDFRMGMSFPNWIVSELAGKHNKVVLSGTGGDELFGGYPWRYKCARGNKSSAELIKKAFDQWQRLVPESDHDKFFTREAWKNMQNYSPKAVFAEVFDVKDIDVKDEEACMNAVFRFEAKTFLHGLLVIEDKISMAFSFEARVPFLDDELVDLALQIPSSLKVDYGRPEGVEGKVILRTAMDSFLPHEVTERKKQGFSAPTESWYKSFDYVEKLLFSKESICKRYINEEYVRNILDEHKRGVKNHRLLIWSLLCFEWWCRVFLK